MYVQQQYKTYVDIKICKTKIYILIISGKMPSQVITLYNNYITNTFKRIAIICILSLVTWYIVHKQVKCPTYTKMLNRMAGECATDSL